MIELLFELILQITVGGIFEVSAQGLSKKSWFPRILNQLLAGIVYFGLGAICGVIVTVFFPYRIIRTNSFRGLSLVVIPLMAALVMVGIGWLRRWQGAPRVRLDTFAYAFVFAFGMALTRFLFVL